MKLTPRGQAAIMGAAIGGGAGLLAALLSQRSPGTAALAGAGGAVAGGAIFATWVSISTGILGPPEPAPERAALPPGRRQRPPPPPEGRPTPMEAGRGPSELERDALLI